MSLLIRCASYLLSIVLATGAFVLIRWLLRKRSGELRRPPARGVKPSRRLARQAQISESLQSETVPQTVNERQDKLVEVIRPKQSREENFRIPRAPEGLLAPVRRAVLPKREVRWVRERDADEWQSPEMAGGVGDGAEQTQASESQAEGGPLSAFLVVGSRWISKDDAVVMRGGHVIKGGFIYVGTTLPPVSGARGTEPALINPVLPIERVDASSYYDKWLDYHPSYRDASPMARAAYLNWLATNRDDQDAAIGNVMLYFYGLERRVLHDAVVDVVSPDEVADIVHEVKRLRDVYAGHPGFVRQATDFLDFVFAADAPERIYLSDPGPVPLNSGVSARIRIAMAQAANDGEWLPASWALAAYWSNLKIMKPPSVRRNAEMFSQLFLSEYAARFGHGVPLPETSDRLLVTYRPANATFCSPMRDLEHQFDLPDPSESASVWECLTSVADACANALDGYARFIARNPDKSDSMDAKLLLPVRFWSAEAQTYLEECRQRVLATRHKADMRTLRQLSAQLPLPVEFSRSQYLLFLERLGEAGIGVEPDPRFGGAVPEADDIVTLFASSREPLKELTDTYRVAQLEVHLGVMVALADGPINQTEISYLSDTFAAREQLSAGQRERLAAAVQHLSLDTPGANGLKRKLDLVPADERDGLGHWLVALAQVDAAVVPAEMRVLEKLFQTLGLEATRLYSLAHSTLAGQSAPVVVRGAETSASPEKRADEFSLDMSRVAQLRAETAQVSSVLGEIFQEDESAPAANQPDAVTAGSGSGGSSESVWGLDAAHSRLLFKLGERAQWSRDEAVQLCNSLGLLLDGALEKLNEAAFERFDEPVTDGDDPLEINQSFILENQS